MRTDFEMLRELTSGSSAGTGTRPAEPTSDGLAAHRPRPSLDCWLPDMFVPGPQDPYPHSLHETLERRSSSTTYGTRPLEAETLLDMVCDALVGDACTWGTEAVAYPLEPFVLLLYPGGTELGIYRVRLDGIDLVRPLPPVEEIESMVVQKEFTRVGVIALVAANLDEADAWGGVVDYRFTMSRSAALTHSLHLRAVVWGLVGTVFAGFATSAIRYSLDSDGVGRHQMFAVITASPQTEPPGQATGQSRLARRERRQPTCWSTVGQTSSELHIASQSPTDHPARRVGAWSR